MTLWYDTRINKRERARFETIRRTVELDVARIPRFVSRSQISHQYLSIACLSTVTKSDVMNIITGKITVDGRVAQRKSKK
ncbi:hypothetical protein CARUB_v10018787mg [Capsella rubella]|uniref:Uncharacterized protein n=1 Tax=Capsella rubella TaxID=81985 RepID=R0H1R8_9BRAS|nr:hypothetical protein CARUB_v10018787mg [Capsella rubella]